MRVLHIIPGKLYGGVETAMVALARFRHVCPEMVTEVAVCFEDRLSEELSALGVPVHVLGEVRVRNPLTVQRARHNLRDLLRQQRFDAVICHMPWVQAIFGPVARAEGIALAFRAHGTLNENLHWTERWAAMTPPDIAICVSRFVAAGLEKLYPGVPAEVVYNPVAPGEALSPTQRAAVRAEAGASPNTVVIAQAGRMQRGKGQQILLEALGLLHELPDWKCWQIGSAQSDAEQEYLSALREQAVRLGIDDRIRFWGQRSDVPRLLAAADVYCQPNDTFPEGLPVAMVEAMLARLPIVATTCVGAASEFIDASCGFLLPPREASPVAATLRRLIEQPCLRTGLANGGLLKARMFVPSVQIPRLYEVLAGVARKPSRTVANLTAPA